MRWTVVIAAGIVSIGCNKGEQSDQPFSGVGARPDVLPVMLNKDLPFRYPPSLYARKVQANVTLRVFIDKEGLVVSESTHVAETSGIPSLDSAAVKGSGELRFIPAKTRGQAVPVSILFPVYFRHPDAQPLPGDTILKKSGVAAIPKPPASSPGNSSSAIVPKTTTNAKPKASSSKPKTASKSASKSAGKSTTTKKR
jgi:TonB family protein